MLFEDTPAPTVDTNTAGQLTEIPAGNGYTSGGQTVNRNVTDFDSLVEDDTLDQARLQLRDYVFTASGGPLPASGSGAAFAGLVDDNVTIADREVIYIFDLGGNNSVSDGQPLTIADATMQTEEPV